jgi:hypothetical protein
MKRDRCNLGTDPIDNLSSCGVSVNFAALWSSRFAVLLFLVAGTHSAATARQASVPSLTFNIEAQISAEGRARVPNKVNAKVYLRGNAVRVDTKMASEPTVLLLVPPYGYRLLPGTKTGVRYKADSLFPEIERSAFSWRDLLASPQQIRHLVESKGGKKIGPAILGGTQTDLYTANRWNGRPAKIKFWLRRSDALPVRMESIEDGIKAVVLWKDYRRGTVTASLMAVPKNYRIRDGRPPRTLWP